MCESHEIAERIKMLLKARDIKANKMLADLALAPCTMTNMKSSYPQINNLIRIAEYLNCSLDYLTGRTDIVEINRGNKD